MGQYSAERTEALSRQMMAPEHRLVAELTWVSEIIEHLLHIWLRQSRDQGTPMPRSGNTAKEWSSDQKFSVLPEMETLNESELSEYCPRKERFLEQIVTWWAACMSANTSISLKTRLQQAQSKEDKIRIRKLEMDLQRKEKTLAEAAALLILRKKPMRSDGINRKTNLRLRSPAIV